MKKAYFGGGCFWCVVGSFDVFEGVTSVISGYMGGHVENPTYKDVKTQESGHYEVVEVTYNEEIIDYNTLLQVFWRQIDPTDSEGQFHDRGPSYRTIIFYTDEEQKILAEKSKAEMDASNRFPGKIVTEIKPLVPFYPAEEYHQDFYKKNPEDYKEDRGKSGRDEFIKKYWGDDYWTIYE
ncbi:MAG: peptide-methionine (S)-S-oxide reductase MsrA [Clostridia bacterium]|nr:peptide-methionine (S)-S-oxide reductase MsrA [Clostridia bacterium]